MHLNLCFLSNPCNDEYNDTNFVQIGPVVFEKLARMSEIRAKKCQTGSDSGEFPVSKSNPTQQKSIKTQPRLVGQEA